MIKFVHKGKFTKTTKFLNFVSGGTYIENVLHKYGREGVRKLQLATPVDSGETARAWDYEIHVKDGEYSIYWTNSHVNKGIPIAILIQYGHGTRNGGYVLPNDFINPAMKDIFENIADSVWKEVCNA